MKALRAFVVRLAGIVDAGRRDREMAEELAVHLEMEVEEKIWRGSLAGLERGFLLETWMLHGLRAAMTSRNLGRRRQRGMSWAKPWGWHFPW